MAKKSSKKKMPGGGSAQPSSAKPPAPRARSTAPKGRPFSALGDEVDYAALVDGVAAGAGLRAPTVFTGRGSALRAAANSALA